MTQGCKAPPACQTPGGAMFVPPRPLHDVSALSELCKALADPTRLQILQLLAMARRPLCVCELENQFNLSQPTVSHHLRLLRDAALVRATRRGTWVYYELNARPLQLLGALQTLWGMAPQDQTGE